MGCICAAGRSEKSALLQQNLTFLEYTSRRYANKYYRLGTYYHRLPLHIRNHEVVPASWQNYCTNAFTISANRELPDLIQILAMVESNLEGAHCAIFRGDVDAAERRLFVAHKLSQEANDRGDELQYAVLQYKWLLRAMGEVDESAVDSRGQDEKSLEEAWKMALPL